MGKTRFSTMAMFSVAGLAGMFLAGAGCGSSGGGGTGGSGGAHDGGGGSGGTGGSGGAHDGGADTGDARDATIGDVATDGTTSTLNYSFDTSTQGFLIDTVAATTPFNLGGGVPDGGSGPTLSFDSTTGMPTAGSLHLTVTFTDYAQVVMVKLDYQLGSLQNLTGKTLTAQIRLDGAPAPSDAGAADGGATDAATTTGSSAFTGVAHLFVLTTPAPVAPATGFYFAQGTSSNLLDNNWHALVFNMANPEYKAVGYDPSLITQLGVQLASPAAPAADSGAPAFGPPQVLSIHFDTLVSN